MLFIYSEAMTKHLAIEWGPNGVRVNCVEPGPILNTVGFSKLGECTCALDIKSKIKSIESQPLKRFI